MRHAILAPLLLAACTQADPFADDGSRGLPPPPQLTLTAPAPMLIGHAATVTVTGDLAVGEIAYIGVSTAAGRGPCPASLGGQCLSITAPRLLGSVTVEETGAAELTFTVPPNLPPGRDMVFQAALVRGINGQATVLSNTDSATSEAAASGCTDPNADNYDPVANLDDGSCTYSDPIDWTSFDFASNDWKNGCTGGAKYVKTTGYAVGAYVGVQLCSATRYKIFLGDDLNGTFYSIGDGCGSGQDHCEFVGGSFANFDVDYSSNAGQPGYLRCSEGETPTLGTFSGAHWTGSWYECGVSLP
ncbi:MAG TPA: hypothetical protein PKA64_26760 [Myxococcota bacterium]|nr:hypothetical protein [Myxococcota bacterium]